MTFPEYLWEKLQLGDLGFASTKIARIKRIFIQNEDINKEMFWIEIKEIIHECIKRCYTGRSRKQKIVEVDEFLDHSSIPLWTKIVGDYENLLENSVPFSTIFELLTQGEFVVINASNLQDEVQYKKITEFCEELISRAKLHWQNSSMKDYSCPILCVIDEIHEFAPEVGMKSWSNRPALRELREFLHRWTSQYAKYGTFLLGVSQFPRQVSKTLTRNMGLRIIGEIDDEDRLVLKRVWNYEIPILSRYQFITRRGGIAPFGQKPLIVKAREPKELKKAGYI